MKLLTTKEACQMLKISRPTLYKLIEQNFITAKKIGNKYRIVEESIIDFIEYEKKLIESFLKK